MNPPTTPHVFVSVLMPDGTYLQASRPVGMLDGPLTVRAAFYAEAERVADRIEQLIERGTSALDDPVGGA